MDEVEDGGWWGCEEDLTVEEVERVVKEAEERGHRIEGAQPYIFRAEKGG
eukprot:CAMPEP_0119124342 /NCGR_PEP_ID=MMETSP1310-20130426/3993_1 /TAXON_ID=464262 /ORGANISM="Genus nov. species nov., Strain RCC2339" /LENGTH=49 /DNA_ID= /DNA_START= /DNA_END= /DNA_ORIENTATION=